MQKLGPRNRWSFFRIRGIKGRHGDFGWQPVIPSAWETGSGIFTRRERESRSLGWPMASGYPRFITTILCSARDRGSWPNKVEAGRITVEQLPAVSRGWLIAIVAHRCCVLGDPFAEIGTELTLSLHTRTILVPKITYHWKLFQLPFIHFYLPLLDEKIKKILTIFTPFWCASKYLLIFPWLGRKFQQFSFFYLPKGGTFFNLVSALFKTCRVAPPSPINSSRNEFLFVTVPRIVKKREREEGNFISTFVTLHNSLCYVVSKRLFYI